MVSVVRQHNLADRDEAVATLPVRSGCPGSGGMTPCHDMGAPARHTRITPSKWRRHSMVEPDHLLRARDTGMNVNGRRLPPAMAGRPCDAIEESCMAIDQVDRTVVIQERPPVAGPAPATPVRQETVRTDSRRITRTAPGNSEVARRVIVLVFGLIQIVIGLRIVLLLLDARTGNALVSGILDVSRIFVAPFEGILNSNALTAGGGTLDVAAVVALIGWSILELIVLWVVGIFRRDPA